MASAGTRVFADTSALIAGLLSRTGAAAQVARLCEKGVVTLVVSPQVIRELSRVVSGKFPHQEGRVAEFLQRAHPELTPEPASEAVEAAARIIHWEDAGILAAATAAGVDFLVTWDLRHFGTSAVRAAVECEIVTPGELLRALRALPEGGPTEGEGQRASRGRRHRS